jgi:peptide/nickel transport system permease protein
MASSEAVARRRGYRRRSTVARVLSGTTTRIAVFVLAAYVVYAVVGLLARPNANAISDAVLASPSWHHLFGTDELGRDVFIRTFAGGGPLIVASLAAAITCVTVGGLFGATLAYRGGRIEFLAMRGVDVLLSIPLIVVALLFAALFPTGYLFLYLLAAAVQVLPVTRVCRGIFADVLHRDFVLAAALRGEPSRRLIVREALPNVTGPLLVELALRWNFSLLLIASLNFLGVGIEPPAADWGVMLYEGRAYLTVAPWIALIPAGLIALLAISINFSADGIARAIGYEHAAGART